MQSIPTIRNRVFKIGKKVKKFTKRVRGQSNSEAGDAAIDVLHVGLSIAGAVADDVNVPGLSAAIRTASLILQLVKVRSAFAGLP